MSSCVVCGRGCVPMADYEVPVCPRCDAAQEDILAAAIAAPVQVVTVTVPAERRPVVRRPLVERVVVHADLTRPVESYYGPAAPEVIAELVDALFPLDRPTARRSA